MIITQKWIVSYKLSNLLNKLFKKLINDITTSEKKSSIKMTTIKGGNSRTKFKLRLFPLKIIDSQTTRMSYRSPSKADSESELCASLVVPYFQIFYNFKTRVIEIKYLNGINSRIVLDKVNY